MFQNAISFIIEKCKSRHAQYYLFANGLLDAFFPWFPPIEVLLTPICTAQPDRWVRMATWGLVGTVLGATLVYLISLYATSYIADILSSIPSLGYDETAVKEQFSRYGFYAIFFLSLLPLPVLFTSFVAGSQEVNYFAFLIAISLARGGRFYFFGLIVSHFSQQIESFLRKHALIVVALLIAGVFLIAALVKLIS